MLITTDKTQLAWFPLAANVSDQAFDSSARNPLTYRT